MVVLNEEEIMTDTKKEYNKVAEGYAKATVRPMRKFAYEATCLRYLKDVSGKNVLDLACGEGVSSRILKSLGAKSVVGLDLSEELIKIAKSHKDGVKYFVRDCIGEDISDFGKFDSVTAIMFLHYSKTKGDIKKAVKNIKSVLKSGGIFYSLTVNPRFLKEGYEKYGIKIVPHGGKEGDETTTMLHDFDWNKYCEFTNYYWSKKTYEEIFDEFGFEIEFLPGVVSQEGLDEYGKDFWKDYLKEPVYMMIKARLK